MANFKHFSGTFKSTNMLFLKSSASSRRAAVIYALEILFWTPTIGYRKKTQKEFVTFPSSSESNCFLVKT